MRDKQKAPTFAPKDKSAPPWHVPIAQAEVPETGLHVELAADENMRKDIAFFAGLSALPRLQASFDITRHGGSGLRVVGQVSATVGQVCGVTLEPMENEIDEAVDLVFLPGRLPGSQQEGRGVEVALEDAPEELVGGVVDLGVLVTEFLVLGIDPYPRKPGSVFVTPTLDDETTRPFAALAALKHEGRGQKR
jgi:uncharacterized metal-binding protein YceD (DUF177 family)